MRQIQMDVLGRLASMTSRGVFKWKRLGEGTLRWVKMKTIKMLLPMDTDSDVLEIETPDGVMVIKGGTPVLKEAVLAAEREVE